LHGVWLGHPLHPVFTDLPLGAWTTGLVLDAVAAVRDDRRLDEAADIAKQHARHRALSIGSELQVQAENQGTRRIDGNQCPQLRGALSTPCSLCDRLP
jgi:hypothetical protein